jgi:hypothetical protein
MSIRELLERVLLGEGQIKDREVVGQVLAEERKQLHHDQQELQGVVLQHSQIVNSSRKILDTMTQAMIMMEARNGGVKE